MAMFKHGGDAGTFSGRAIRAVERSGGSRANVSTVHTGQGFMNALIQASKKEPIDKLYVASHSAPTGLYGDNNSGFYSGPVASRVNNLYEAMTHEGVSYAPPTDAAAFISDLADKVGSGEIRFAENAEIVFLGCNTARGGLGVDSFAEDLSEALPGLKVTGAQGYSAPADKAERSFRAKAENNPASADRDWVTYQNGKQVKNHGSTYTPGNE